MNFNGIRIQERFISVIHVFGAKRAAIACGVLLGALSLNAREINVPTQPTSLYADSEVSTNLILNASRHDVKELNINIPCVLYGMYWLLKKESFIVHSKIPFVLRYICYRSLG